MAKIYIVPGLANPPHECHYHAVAEDEEILFMTGVMSEEFAKSVLLNPSPEGWYQKIYWTKYPGGFELEYVRDWTKHSLVRKACGVDKYPDVYSKLRS